MARKHPAPIGSIQVPVFRDLDPVLSVGAIGDYFGVSKGLASKWARESPDFPEVFAKPPSGALYVTAEVIAWGVRHERKRSEGPRPIGDPRLPSVRKATRRRAAA